MPFEWLHLKYQQVSYVSGNKSLDYFKSRLKLSSSEVICLYRLAWLYEITFLHDRG